MVDLDTDLDTLCFETTQIKKKLIQHGLINLNKESQLGNKRKEKLDLNSSVDMLDGNVSVLRSF